MNCSDVEKLFDRYLDNELDPKEASRLETHISECAKCTQNFAALIKIKKGLSSFGDQPAPSGFRKIWMDRLYSLPAHKHQKKFTRYLPAMAAGIAVVVLGTALLTSGIFSPAAPQSAMLAAESAAQSAAGGAALENAQDSVAVPPQSAAPEADSSLFMAQAAPSEAEVPAPQLKSSANDTAAAAIPVEISQDTLNDLANMFASYSAVKIEFSQSENHLTIDITDENQNAVADILKQNGLQLSPAPGEVYDFYYPA